MVRKIVTLVIVLPLALIFVVFAIANRQLVTVSFDPFNTTDPSLAISLPLFAVIILSVILGVLAGGIATWLKHMRSRQRARQRESDAAKARADAATGRALAPVSPPPGGFLRPRA